MRAALAMGISVALAFAGLANAESPKSAGASKTAAQGASFDCARATLPVEKDICASPALRSLDRQIAAAYRAALVRHGQNESAEALRDDQRQFNAVRAGAGASPYAVSLQDMMEARRDMLRSLTGPRTQFVGRWTSYNGDIAIRRSRNGLTVEITTVEPTAGRWTCTGAGVLAVGRDMQNAGVVQLGEGWSLEFVMEGGALSVTTRKPPGAADENPHCGMNGAFDGLYLASR